MLLGQRGEQFYKRLEKWKIHANKVKRKWNLIKKMNISQQNQINDYISGNVIN